MAQEKNGEDRLLACLKVQGEVGPRQDVQLPVFSFSSGKKRKGELMEENFWSSNFCDNHSTTNSLE